MQAPSPTRRDRKAFTLVEMLVSVAVLAGILIILFEMTSATGRIWNDSTRKIGSFQEARAAFESMTRKLRQATLNTYYDYFDANGLSARDNSSPATFTAARYGRQSELHFISGPGLLAGQVSHAVFFHAPTGYTGDAADYPGLSNALNAIGFFVVYNSDDDAGARPPFITGPGKFRYRLMQFTQKTEDLQIYKYPTGVQWFTAGPNAVGKGGNTQLLADNIIALVILPKKSAEEDPQGDSLSPGYAYDSRTPWTGDAQPEQMNQLPPLLHVVLAAIDERSAQRICTSSTAPDLGVSKLFSKADDLAADLETLQATLNQKRIGYRIFQTDIAIRGAKWSQ